MYLTLLLSKSVAGQATRLVDPIDPAYRDLQQLADAGLVSVISLGQRPLSRAAFATAADEATARLANQQGLRAKFYAELVASLRQRLELSPDSAGRMSVKSAFAPIRSLSADGTYTDDPTRAVPADNGLGGINAHLNTMLDNRQGRPLSEGTTAVVESEHTLETHYVAVSATPQLAVQEPLMGRPRTGVQLQELQARLVLGNVAIDLGREYVVWGEGRDVGLLNSNSSPALNLVRLSSERPFFLPWIFRRLGPSRGAIFLTDLGADQNFPHPYGVGYRGTFAPAEVLGLGFSVYTKSGGQGAPRASATARLIDLLPFLDASAYNNVIGTRGDFQFSDHYAGVDGRIRVPPLSASIYWEILLNDFDIRRLSSVVWDDAGHVFGVNLPALAASGRLRPTLEYHHTGLRYYEHQQFVSGQTLHGVLTGDPLGPNAEGGYAFLEWYPTVQHRVNAQLAIERRSSDLYTYLPEPHFGFRRTDSRPKELRSRIVASWQLLPDRRQLGGLVQVGYERTRNFDFIHANDRNGFLARVALQYRFE
jgi:hypothetical protein